ncbi:MAG: ATP-binding protein [Isosphaeraceae bacterium]|nr:ATP-binding protein [Isosphaeraceae bacterium]
MNRAIEHESSHRRGLAEVLLPTRAAALEGVRTGLLAQEGPVLITGEAGVGKTWLSRRLQAELAYPWRWARADLTPATDPVELLRAIGRGLGLGEKTRRADRWDFVDALAESAAEGERWGLVLEEAHNASDSVWEEIRVLANHLGEPGGFAGIVLIGQTPLARRLRTRALAALEARLACQVHLKPLDRDEALRFLEHAAPGWSASERARDELHRDAAGIPRRLAQASARLEGGLGVARNSGRLLLEPTPSPAPTTPAAGRIESEPLRPTPPPVPVKPPLHEEEGLIEVGWDPSDPEPNDDALAAPAPGLALGDSEAAGTTEEPINDHYAALQAWTEWAQNQGRTAAAASAGTLTTVEDSESLDPDMERVPAAGHPSVWAEGQHGFAPYSQLFSRLKQSRDSQ